MINTVGTTAFQWHVKPWVVKLDESEMRMGEIVGNIRRDFAIRNKIKAADNAPEDERARTIDILGTLGEIASAKALNMHWQPAMVYDAAQIDVGGSFEIRTTDNPYGNLIMKKKDRDYLPYILVIAKPPYFKLVGWMMGRDAKSDQYWDVGKAAGGKLRVPNWLVPSVKLKGMDEISLLRLSND